MAGVATSRNFSTSGSVWGLRAPLCMAVDGCIWLYMAVYSCIWLYMAVYGCIWLYMAVCISVVVRRRSPPAEISALQCSSSSSSVVGRRQRKAAHCNFRRRRRPSSVAASGNQCIAVYGCIWLYMAALGCSGDALGLLNEEPSLIGGWPAGG